MRPRCRSPPIISFVSLRGGLYMGYDYKKEYARWKKWKDNEEKILRKHNIDETLINELRDFDWEQFNENRRFSRNQNVTKDIFFYMQPVHDKK